MYSTIVSVVRMAEWSKAPDSRIANPYRTMQSVRLQSILVHECGRGFESHF